jgi:hypothetical protein
VLEAERAEALQAELLGPAIGRVAGAPDTLGDDLLNAGEDLLFRLDQIVSKHGEADAVYWRGRAMATPLAMRVWVYTALDTQGGGHVRSAAALAIGCLSFAALSACSSSGSPAPSTVRLKVEAPLAERAQTVARDYLSNQHLSVELTDDAKLADVTIAPVPSGDKDTPQFPMSFWVAVVQLPSRASALTAAQLGDAVGGKLNDWSSITGAATPLRVIVPADAAPPFAQWWPDTTPRVESMALDQIPAALADDPGALAIVPLDAVNAAMRSLDIDGTNVVFGSGEFASYALAEHRWVTTRKVDSQKFAALLRDLSIELAKQLAVAPPDPIIMRVTGDIIPARCALAKIQSYGDYKHPFLQLGPWLKQADITVGSLDSSLADVSPPWPCVDTFNLAAPSAAIEGLTYSGFDVITNAANHAMDCGQVGACGAQALLETNANLRKNGIQPVGSGADLAAARTPVIVTSKGVRFAFLGYDDIQTLYHAEPGVAGTAPLDEAFVREDVAAAAAQAAVVIVMPHWGIEYQAEPTDRQRTIARAAVESGAGLVLGNHPHWVEANEMIDGSFVEYALGNFVFDQDWSLETQQGAVLEVAFAPDGRGGAQLKGVRYYAVHIWDEQQPRLAEPAEAQQILDRIWNASAALR